MTESISVNELPSVKYEEKLKHSINYNTLETSIKNVIKDDEINSWVQNLKSKVEFYLNNSPDHFSFNNDKRCKDFNYLITKIINLIHSLSDNMEKIAAWSDEIKNWRDDYFSRNPSLICDKNNKYGDLQLKDLYDLCEDNIFILEKLEDIKKSDKCESIISNLSERKNKLKSKEKILQRKIVHEQILDVQCSTEILKNAFPSFNCTPITRSATSSDSHAGNDNQLASETSVEMLKNHSSSSPGDITDEKERSNAFGGESKTSNSPSSNASGLISLSILGVLVLSFLLYRYTHLGPKLHNYIFNKEGIPIHHNDKTTEQTLSNISNYEDTYSENLRYNLSYQTLEN
ncbi:PIR Superfamily Protein [Plasmodium ovale curtisi]|uniref:PIR Superfamily Protein n=1 Tax=Plasmodium ovale curtisi TaxID=864141 RepID=A0A1A8XDR2_PLAOA|nr:PIR Superfamily Protein [Plasmodium ovale curtisi]